VEKTFDTLQQMLNQSVEKHANKNCLSFVDGNPIKYKEFGNQVAKLSNKLVDLGINKGDKVAILSHNMPNWGIVYFSVVNIGAVTVPLMPDFSDFELENILLHADVKTIFVSQRLSEKVQKFSSENNINIIIIDDLETIFSSVNNNFNSNEYKVLADDLATIVYTSGTTGNSKGVMLTHHNLVSQIIMVSHLQPVYDYDIFLSILPLSHTYECSLGLLTGIMSGASTYYLEKPPTPSILLPALKKVKPTMMLTVPLIIEKVFKNSIYPKLTATTFLRILYSIKFFRKLLHKKASKALYDTFGGNLRFFGIGGAKLSSHVEQFLLDGKIFPYAIGYGLTETAPLIAGANPQTVKLQSTGKALVGVELMINNPNSITGEGEIWAKGDNIMQGYYKEDEITKSVFQDGWFKTGDLGVFDKQNRLYIKSRLKNVIIGANGENIYPEDIESVINSFKCVVESIVVEQKGKLVAMVQFNKEELEKYFLHLKEEMEVKVEKVKYELLEYVNSRVNKISKISVVVSVSSDFERTSTQKIKRYKYTGIN